MVEELGYAAVEAEDGLQALEVIEAQAPSVVLMDINMPRLGGMEALRALRASETGRRTPVLAVTADATTTRRRACAAAGFDGFIEKPVDMDRLREALGSLIPQA
jgi:CheY-like chemotaxis protein